MSEYLNMLKTDYALYFEKCLKIRNKDGEIVPFIPNDAQRRLLKMIEEWKAEYPNPRQRPTMFIIIPKARQVGISTCVEGIIMHELNFEFNKVGMIISYDMDSAAVINDMANRFYQYLPQDIKPQRRKSVGKGILFENPKFDSTQEITKANDPGLQNKFLIETANNIAAGSSYTINALHISELAKWQNPEETMTSLMQSVPKNGAVVFVESTARGMNYFYDLCNQAKHGLNNFKLFFIPWHEHKEYRLPVKGDFVTTDEEEELKKLYNLDNEQIAWRRETIRNKCYNDIDIFHQEYPQYLEESFLTTGKPVFDNTKLMIRIEELKKEKKGVKGNLVYVKSEGRKDEKLEFLPDNYGYVTVYKMPEPNTPYIVGADLAEGREGGDYSVCQVVDAITLEQVAVWHGHMDTDLFTREMYKMGQFYNWALLAPEINFNPGVAINLSEYLRYPKIYMRQKIDTISHRMDKERYGWRTDRINRPVIIDDLVQHVRETPHLINDIPTLEEMMVFIKNEQGRPEAQPGKHDDRVLALAIAIKCREQQSKSGGKRKVPSLKGLPQDCLNDYYKASPKEKVYLLHKWGKA